MKPSYARLAMLLAIAYANYDPGLASTALRANHYPRRSQRATVPFDSSLEKLKSVARVANGISLSRQLIDGVEKAEMDGIISELLKMGTATPDQVISYRAEEMKTAINSIKSLQQGLKGGDDVKKVEDNWNIMFQISKDLEGIADFKSWPDQASYKTAVEKLKNNGVDVSVIENLKSKITAIDNSYKKIKNQTVVALSYMEDDVDSVINWIGQLNSTVPKFSDGGTAIDLLSVPVKIARSVNATKSFNTVSSESLQESESNLMSMLNIGQNLGQPTVQFELLIQLIGTRNKLGAARKLQHTSGLPEGLADLGHLQADLRNGLMVDIINSTQLEGAVSELRMLETSLNKFESKIKPHADKLKSIDSVRWEIEKLIAFSAGSADGNAALASLKSCGSIPSGGSTTDIDTIVTASRKIDSDFQAIQTTISQVLAQVEQKNLVAELTSFKAICNSAKRSNPDERKLKGEAEPYKDSLITPLNQIHSLLSAIVFPANTIKTTATAAAGVADKIQAVLTSINGGNGLFSCLQAINVNDLKLISDAVKMVRVYRQLQGGTKQLDATLAVSEDVSTFSSSLPQLKTAIDGMKGRETDESKLLTLLADPKKTSDNVGKAVQAVIRMDQVFQKKSHILTVVANIDQISSSMSSGLDPNDAALLTSLTNLKTNFSSMNTSIHTWHDAVKDKSLTTLEDAKSIFTPSKAVTGIDDDLVPMVAALGRLVEASPANTQLANLQDSLKELASLDLNFASSSTSLSSAESELGVLKDFFAAFGLAVADLAQNAQKNVSGEGGISYGRVGGADKKQEEIRIWFIIVVVVGGILFIAAIIALIYGYIRLKNTEEEVDSANVEANEANKRATKAEAETEEAKRKLDELVKGMVTEGKERGDEVLAAVRQMSRPQAPLQLCSTIPVVGNENRSVQLQQTQPLSLTMFWPLSESIKNFIIATQRMIASYQTGLLGWVNFRQLCSELIGYADREGKAQNKNPPQQYRKFCRRVRPIVENTRVQMPKDCYIHANYVRFGTPEKPQFSMIAAQAPTKENIPMYWRMINREKVDRIAQLCKNMENDVEKCAVYVPNNEGDKLEFEKTTVTCVTRETALGGRLVIRRVHVLLKDENLAWECTHYHYLAWPDHGVPASEEDIADLMKLIRDSALNVLVHCSAGEGRTGCIAFIETCVAWLNRGETSIYGMLYSVRQQRFGAVETPQQLAFSLRVALYMVMQNCTDETLKERYRKLDEVLNDSATQPDLVPAATPHQLANAPAFPPGTARPGPSSAEPAASPAQPAPSAAKPAASPAQPAPSPAQPAPSAAKPAASPAQPAPSPVQPAPSAAKPAASPAQPAPSPAQPAASPAQPAPSASQPAASPAQPAPSPAQPDQAAAALAPPAQSSAEPDADHTAKEPAESPMVPSTSQQQPAAQPGNGTAIPSTSGVSVSNGTGKPAGNRRQNARDKVRRTRKKKSEDRTVEEA